MALFSKFSDRRITPRRPANTRGLLVAPELEMVCLITDESSSGLRIRLDRAVSLPPSVTLVDIAAGTACEAQVAWTKGQEAGLKCPAKPTSLHGLVPARFSAARQAWLRAGGR